MTIRQEPNVSNSNRRAFLKAGGVTCISGGLGALAALAWSRAGTRQPNTSTATPTESPFTAKAASQAGVGDRSDSSHSDSPTESPLTTTTAEEEQPVASTSSPTQSLIVLCRESWGAAPPIGVLSEHFIERLTVHHTAVAFDDPTAGPRRVRDFQASHQSGGFADLAYHFVVDGPGNIYEARATNTPGETYTSYDPAGHFLAVCDGNFEDQAFPDAQFESLALLLAWASIEFDISPATLGGHYDYAATACPGSGLTSRLADGSLRQEIEHRLAAGPVEMVLLGGSQGDERVRAISEGRS